MTEGVDAVVRGRPEAALAILPGPAESEAARTGKLRKSGVLRAVVPLVAAAALFYFQHVIASYVALGVGSLTLLLALVSPTRGYVALVGAVDRLGQGMGQLLTWLLLGPVYFLFFVPFGLLLRRGRGDRMGRTFDRSATTYWTTRPNKTRDLERAALERPY